MLTNVVNSFPKQMLTDCVDLSNDEIALMMWWSRFMMADNNP